MKIAFFSDTFYPQFNGITTVIANISRELASRGHDIVIFAPKLHAPTVTLGKRVTFVPLRSIPVIVNPEYRLSVFGLPTVLRVLKAFKPDILHFHTPASAGFDAILSAKILGKPLVGTIHAYLTQPDYLSWIKQSTLLKLVANLGIVYSRLIYNRCQLRFAPSKRLIAELRRVGFREPLVYLPNPVTPTNRKSSLSYKERDRLKRDYGLKQDVILHFGRFSAEKRIDQVIRASAPLIREDNTSLLLIGDGLERSSLQALAHELAISQDTIFTGFVDHEKLMSSGLIALGDVFVTASTMENRPMVVLEAMSFGLPIVAVRQAGMTELVKGNGFLVREGDIAEMSKSIQRIIREPGLRKRLGQASSQLASAYLVTQVVDELLSWYNKL